MKQVSSRSTGVMFVLVILFFVVMVVMTILYGNIPLNQLYIVLLAGYFPMGIILYIMFNIYKCVYIGDMDSIIAKNPITRGEKIIEKKDILKIAPLSIMKRSPSYYIKYKNKNQKTRYYLFTKRLFTSIDNEISQFN